MDTVLPPALTRAVELYGIELVYTDTWGKAHHASEDGVRRVLGALGVPLESPEATEHFLDHRVAQLWSRAVDATLVVPEDADAIPLRVPADHAGASVKLEIEWENGECAHWWHALPELKTLEEADVQGVRYLKKRLPLPGGLRLGYHRIRLYWMKEPALEVLGCARFIVCPRHARKFEGRAAGVSISLYGLRSSRNWGCGDFTDLALAVEAFAQAGAAFIALNPLHAIANREPYNTSPYLPQSSSFRNFLYLDVERAPGFAPEHEYAEEARALRETEFVEYERVASLKLRALTKAFERFLEAGTDAAFEAYRESEGDDLHQYAVYCALDEEMHRRDPEVWLWTQWPFEYQDPESAAVAEFALQFSARVLFFKFLQWQVDVQLGSAQAAAQKAQMKIGLYHDLALATDRFGEDLWSNRRFYIARSRVGAPPDELGPGGQDWAFPPPNKEAHRADGYQHFTRSIRKNSSHGGALRIDHVMRFFRLFWIPEGLTAREGLYVRDYVDDLLGIIALESVRQGFYVIGEDLGTVAPEVRDRLASAGILGYRLLWFERNLDGTFRAPSEYPARAAVSTSTHDLATLAGFFSGRDIEARKTSGLVDEAGYHEQLAARQNEIVKLNEALVGAGFPGDGLGFILATPSTFAIVNQEDLTGEEYQQNLPASTWQYPNWRRKMKVAVEDFGPLVERLGEMIERSGRL
jgi:4-alpha-glucanotransferase